MVTEKNIKSAEDDLMVSAASQIIISSQGTREASATILNDKVTANKDCGKFKRCVDCKLRNL